MRSVKEWGGPSHRRSEAEAGQARSGRAAEPAPAPNQTGSWSPTAVASAGASQTLLEWKEAPGLQERPDPVGSTGPRACRHCQGGPRRRHLRRVPCQRHRCGGRLWLGVGVGGNQGKRRVKARPGLGPGPAAAPSEPPRSPARPRPLTCSCSSASRVARSSSESELPESEELSSLLRLLSMPLLTAGAAGTGSVGASTGSSGILANRISNTSCGTAGAAWVLDAVGSPRGVGETGPSLPRALGRPHSAHPGLLSVPPSAPPSPGPERGFSARGRSQRPQTQPFRSWHTSSFMRHPTSCRWLASLFSIQVQGCLLLTGSERAFL